MKKMIFAAALAAGMMGLGLASCEKSFEELAENGGSKQSEQAKGKAHVKLHFTSATSASVASASAGEDGSGVPAALTRASLTANGKELTDLYIFDYDKKSGKLLQVLHQTSKADDFAEPDLTLDYGDHTLKVVATRSEASGLQDAQGATWTVSDDVLSPITTTEPAILASTKTSDTFGGTKDITVSVGQTKTINVQLDRLVAKLVLKSTDVFPDDCSTIQVSLDEYKTFSWQKFDVIDPVKNDRISDVSDLAGTTGNTISYFLLVPADGYQTDITFTMNRQDSDKPYSTITLNNVPFERNHPTVVTGSFYNHQAGFSLTVNDEWSKEENQVGI